jgi:hypothetical protein
MIRLLWRRLIEVPRRLCCDRLRELFYGDLQGVELLRRASGSVVHVNHDQ